MTKSEEQIIELLWSVDEPLTSTEIVDKSVDKTWKDSYVHLLINSLLDKGMIEVTAVKRTTKNYARAFSPTLSREEYMVSLLTGGSTFSVEFLPKIVAALVETTDDETIISEIDKTVTLRKRQLKAAK